MSGDSYSLAFLEESRELLSDSEQLLLQLEQDPTNRDMLNQLFRNLHTIKGNGAIFGFTELSSFAHHLETLLDQARNGNLELDTMRIDTILSCVDQIHNMLNAPEEYTLNHPQIEEMISQLREMELVVLDEDLPEEQVEKLQCKVETAPPTEAKEKIKPKKKVTFRIQFTPELEVFKCGTNPLHLLDELKEMGEYTLVTQLDSLPEWKDFDPENCYLSWEMFLSTTADQEEIEDVFMFLSDDSTVEIKEIQNKERPLGEILKERGVISNSQLFAALEKRQKIGEILKNLGLVNSKDVESALAEQKITKRHKFDRKKVRRDNSSHTLEKINHLIFESQRIRNRFRQFKRPVKIPILNQGLSELDRICEQMNGVIEQAQTLSLIRLKTRLRREVRAKSLESKKPINFLLRSPHERLDRIFIETLEQVLSALVHQLIDSCIESPAERQELNKDPIANIDLEIIQDNEFNRIILGVDGYGRISKDDFLKMLSANNFLAALSSLKLEINVESLEKSHSIIRVTFPRVKQIQDGSLVKTSGQLLVIPEDIIQERVFKEEIKDDLSPDNKTLNQDGDAIPIYHLQGSIDLQKSSPEVFFKCELDGKEFFLSAEEYLGPQQIAINKFHRHFLNNTLYGGTTLFSDGTSAQLLNTSFLKTLI